MERLGIVLKIETRGAFGNLPELLFNLLQLPDGGVMIVRGGCSAAMKEAGLQKEILCLSGAAHLPVIWATQVLEELSKSGKPSRAEITDAARGVRANASC